MTSEDSPAGTQALEGREFRPADTYILAAAVGITSMSFNFWYPFLPLYMLKLGATSNASALFWVAVATSAQGIARLATGPLWGTLSDRYGRKMMFLRALYLSTLIGAVAAFATAPWHIAIALTLAGFFSGFSPAAIAFVSVSVPDSRLNASLGTVSAAQYMGTTVGPALGAIFAVALGYRGAILAGSFIPLLAGTAVLLFVPRDHTPSRSAVEGEEAPPELEPFHMSSQFLLAIFLYFLLFALNQLTRLATPIALRVIEGHSDVASISGIAFTLGGLVSAISVLFLAPRLFREGRFRRSLVASCLVASIGCGVLAIAPTATVYIGGFLLVALILSGMSPAVNTLVAANAIRSRRGTAFGVASSAQAVSFIVGPGGAALFAALSLDLGFAFLALLLIAVAALVLWRLREPVLSEVA